MENEQVGGNHGLHWTSSMSTYMLTHFTNVVANGTKTSTGFKTVHHNACARDLNDHFRLSLTGGQIANHVRYWKKKWAKIIRLKNALSGSLWDEFNFIIRLDHEHYAEHIKVL